MEQSAIVSINKDDKQQLSTFAGARTRAKIMAYFNKLEGEVTLREAAEQLQMSPEGLYWQLRDRLVPNKLVTCKKRGVMNMYSRGEATTVDEPDESPTPTPAPVQVPTVQKKAYTKVPDIQLELREDIGQLQITFGDITIGISRSK